MKNLTTMKRLMFGNLSTFPFILILHSFSKKTLRCHLLFVKFQEFSKEPVYALRDSLLSWTLKNLWRKLSN